MTSPLDQQGKSTTRAAPTVHRWPGAPAAGHKRRRGRFCRNHVSQNVFLGNSEQDRPAIRRIAMVDQIHSLRRQPEIVVVWWRAARVLAPVLTQAAVGR